MQTLETTDLKEVRRCRIAQFNGTSRTLKVGETSITGFVRSVREVKTLRTAKLLLVFTQSIRVQWPWVRRRWKVVAVIDGALAKAI